jgi:hypothetical protein
LLQRRNRSDLTEEIRNSIIDRLKANGLWPPPDEVNEI